MTPREWLTELRRRDPVLVAGGWFHLALLVLMVVVAPFDARTITGLNPWIKPMKFAVSDTVYLWTLAWLSAHLPGPRWARRTVSWGASIAMVTEILCVTLQAARGVTSHYNVSTVFNVAVFRTMGFMIFVNTSMAVLFLALFLRSGSALPRAYLWGIRLGTLLFILGSVEGAVMISRNAHTVGLADGGPGLPLLNWSTRAGDLRVAHLLGLHSLQVLPLVGYAMGRLGRLRPMSQVAAVFGFAAIYAAAGALLFWQALSAKPLLALRRGAALQALELMSDGDDDVTGQE